MKSSLFYGSLLAAPLASAIQPPALDGLHLSWQESFDGCAGCAPNPDEWNVALNTNTNNERQEYTDSNSNIQLSGGQTLQLVPWKDGNGAWTSGRIETQDSFTPQPGKIMRVQAALRMGTNANRQGLWPAFWLLGDAMRHGTDWPMCGEIDVMEQVNGIPEGHGTVHCGQPEGGVCNEPTGLGRSVGIPDSEFHSWGIVIDRTSNNWQAETISWFLDGNVYSTLSGAQIGDEGTWATLAHSPLYLILNVAVGGNWPVSSLSLARKQASIPPPEDAIPLTAE